MDSDRYNIISHTPRPKFEQFLTLEQENGLKTTVAMQKSHARKAMVSRFLDEINSPKNHKEFSDAQAKKPVSLYGRPAG